MKPSLHKSYGSFYDTYTIDVARRRIEISVFVLFRFEVFLRGKFAFGREFDTFPRKINKTKLAALLAVQNRISTVKKSDYFDDVPFAEENDSGLILPEEDLTDKGIFFVSNNGYFCIVQSGISTVKKSD